MLSEDDIDQMARLAHDGYARGVPGADAPATPWEALEEWQREANRDSVRFAPALLVALGLRVSPEPAGQSVQVVLDEEEVEAGARLEHLRWTRFTLRSGKVDHPDLRPWSELDEATRDKDRSRVRESIELLARVGMSVSREGRR